MNIESVTPLVILKKERLSIGEMATLVVNFYKKFAAVDSGYNQLSIVSEKKSVYQSIDIHDVDAISFLAEEIINQNIEDIRKRNNVDKVDFNFSRENMISFSLAPAKDPESLMGLSHSFSTMLPRIGPIIVNQDCLNSYSKAKWFLETARESFSVDSAVIKVSTKNLRDISRKYHAPLNWINYFSDDGEWQIPDDLEGFEYEKVEGGKYLILSRDYIGSDSGRFEAATKKLAQRMEELGERVPGYKK